MAKKLEDTHQEHFFKWLKLYPFIDALTWATPNGGRRDAKEYVTHDGKKKRFSMEGAALKRRGVKKGVPDIFCAIPVNGYAGLFIELKALDGKPSKEQAIMIDKLTKQNYKCHVCYSWFEARHALLKYFKDTDYVKRSPVSIEDYKASVKSATNGRGRPRKSYGARA